MTLGSPLGKKDSDTSERHPWCPQPPVCSGALGTLPRWALPPQDDPQGGKWTTVLQRRGGGHPRVTAGAHGPPRARVQVPAQTLHGDCPPSSSVCACVSRG